MFVSGITSNGAHDSSSARVIANHNIYRVPGKVRPFFGVQFGWEAGMLVDTSWRVGSPIMHSTTHHDSEATC